MPSESVPDRIKRVSSLVGVELVSGQLGGLPLAHEKQVHYLLDQIEPISEGWTSICSRITDLFSLPPAPEKPTVAYLRRLHDLLSERKESAHARRFVDQIKVSLSTGPTAGGSYLESPGFDDDGSPLDP